MLFHHLWFFVILTIYFYRYIASLNQLNYFYLKKTYIKYMEIMIKVKFGSISKNKSVNILK